MSPPNWVEVLDELKERTSFLFFGAYLDSGELVMRNHADNNLNYLEKIGAVSAVSSRILGGFSLEEDTFLESPEETGEVPSEVSNDPDFQFEREDRKHLKSSKDLKEADIEDLVDFLLDIPESGVIVLVPQGDLEEGYSIFQRWMGDTHKVLTLLALAMEHRSLNAPFPTKIEGSGLGVAEISDSEQALSVVYTGESFGASFNGLNTLERLGLIAVVGKASYASL